MIGSFFADPTLPRSGVVEEGIRQPLDRIEDNKEKSPQILYGKESITPAVLVIGSTFLSQHLKNGDPSLERCVASSCTKRLKDQQGPHLGEPGSKQTANTARLRGIFLFSFAG